MGLLDLSFEKRLVIRNRRLNAMYHILMGTAIAFGVSLLVSSRDFLTVHDADVRMLVDVSPSQDAPEGSAHIGGAIRGFSQLCGAGADCTSGSLESTYILEASNQLLAFASVSVPGPDGNRTLLVPTLDHLRLRFSFDYQLRRPVTSRELASPLARRPQISGTSADAHTVVVDPDGQVVAEHRPGEEVAMSVAELLVRSRSPDGRAVELVDGSLPRWVRERGAEVRVSANCYGDPEQVPVRVGHAATHEAPVCVLAAAVVRRGAEKPRASLEADRLTKDHFRGVRVRCENGHGFFPALSVGGLVVVLASLRALLTLPETLTLAFTVHCLGILARIYHTAIYEEFSIRRNVAGLAARLMVSSSAFNELADTSPEPGDEDDVMAISRTRIEESIHELCSRQKGLDADSVADMVSFCHLHILDSTRHQTAMEDMRECAGTLCRAARNFRPNFCRKAKPQEPDATVFEEGDRVRIRNSAADDWAGGVVVSKHPLRVRSLDSDADSPGSEYNFVEHIMLRRPSCGDQVVVISSSNPARDRFIGMTGEIVQDDRSPQPYQIDFRDCDDGNDMWFPEEDVWIENDLSPRANADAAVSIDSCAFATACVFNDHRTPFFEFVKLFDQKRRRGLLERLFYPPSMRTDVVERARAESARVKELRLMEQARQFKREEENQMLASGKSAQQLFSESPQQHFSEKTAQQFFSDKTATAAKSLLPSLARGLSGGTTAQGAVSRGQLLAAMQNTQDVAEHAELMAAHALKMEKEFEAVRRQGNASDRTSRQQNARLQSIQADMQTLDRALRQEIRQLRSILIASSRGLDWAAQEPKGQELTATMARDACEESRATLKGRATVGDEVVVVSSKHKKRDRYVGRTGRIVADTGDFQPYLIEGMTGWFSEEEVRCLQEAVQTTDDVERMQSPAFSLLASSPNPVAPWEETKATPEAQRPSDAPFASLDLPPSPAAQLSPSETRPPSDPNRRSSPQESFRSVELLNSSLSPASGLWSTGPRIAGFGMESV